MSHITENDRAPARCDGCEKIYPVHIRSNGTIDPIGIPHCLDCGGSEFTVFGERGVEIVPTDKLPTS